MSHERAPRGGHWLGHGDDSVAAAIDRKRPIAAPVPERDWCGADGALELGRRIESFWTARGRQIAVSFERSSFKFPLTAVRSDLRNGLPRRDDKR